MPARRLQQPLEELMVAAPRHSSVWRRWAVWSVAIGALVLVFAAYRNPHLVVDLANRLWACF